MHGDVGAAVVNHKDVDKVAFTGSTAVGKTIQRAIAGTQKRCTLELGGKAANIIFEDATIDQAVEGIVNGIFLQKMAFLLVWKVILFAIILLLFLLLSLPSGAVGPK